MALDGITKNMSFEDKGGERTFEPQRQNNAILRIEDIPGEGGGPGGPLELALRTFPAPKSSHNVVEDNFLNEIRKFAGKRTYEDMSVEYRSFVNRDTLAILSRWYGQVQNVGGDDVGAGINNGPQEDGAIGLASQYKKQADVIQVGPNFQFERTHEIFGMWPSNLDPGDFDMSGSELVAISVTFTIDKVRYIGSQSA